MARRKTPETLDDLLAPILKAERFTEWCEAHGMRPFTILRARQGAHRVSAGTIALLVAGLLAEGIRADRARVEAACKATRAAAGKG